MNEKKITKNLAHCTPREFAGQSVKIAMLLSEWDILDKLQGIRADTGLINGAGTAEEQEQALREQVKNNALKMINILLVENIDKALELLGLVFFIDLEEIDNYTVADFLEGLEGILNDKRIISFFMSCLQLGAKNISKQ